MFLFRFQLRFQFLFCFHSLIGFQLQLTMQSNFRSSFGYSFWVSISVPVMFPVSILVSVAILSIFVPASDSSFNSSLWLPFPCLYGVESIRSGSAGHFCSLPCQKMVNLLTFFIYAQLPPNA